jgi:putative ABC transport system permease protein
VFKVSRKNLRAHKRRLVSTFLAVLLGVAFLSGTLIVTATLNATFEDLFETGGADTDTVVRAQSTVEAFGIAMRGRLSDSVLPTIDDVDGVVAAQPIISGSARIVTADGEALGSPGQGPPTFAENWPDVPEVNAYRVVDGRAPAADNEVVIDRGSADEGKVAVGDAITLLTEHPVQLTVVGIVTFGDQDSAGGSTYAGLTFAAAEQDIVGQPGLVDSIRVVGEPSLSQQELTDRIAEVLPPGVEAVTKDQQVKENQDDIQNGFLRFFNTFLLVFAGIAVVVAVFSIYNTFSILVSQRTREMALLRAVGASRRQVLGSVLVEALAVGVLASIGGLLVGFGVAQLLKGLLTAFGFSLPARGLVFGPSTVIASLIVGIVVTALAGLSPAVKATRIPPIAAIRDVAVEQTRASKVRIGIGVFAVALGVLGVVTAVVGKSDQAVGQAGIGALFTLVGAVILGPVAAGPASRVLGAPLPMVKGVTGNLARENAIRNPRRTSGTAAALMIGVAVVSLFTIFAASLKATIDDQINEQFAGDLVVASQGFGPGGISPDLVRQANELPEVAAASGLRFGIMSLDGSATQLIATDPTTLPAVLDIGVSDGSLDDLGADGIAVSKSKAEDKDWTIGTLLDAQFIDGTSTQLRITALYDNSDVIGTYLLGLEAWEPHALDNFDSFVAIKLADGVSIEEGRAAIQPLVDEFAVGSDLQDRQQFADSQAAQINQILGLIYTLLALAIVISLMGIANTLSLSITERTRELGLLRAVGMIRGQLRSSVRWESVIIALFGTLGGLAIGVFFSWALVQAASDEGVKYQLPAGSLIVLILLGALAGVAAALRPGWRAAKLDVLRAIATE